MTFDYDEIADVAQDILEEMGQAVTLKHTDPGTYNPATGGYTGGSTITQYGYGAVVDWESRHIDGTLIKIGDRRLLLSPLNTAGAALTAPVLNDTVTDAAGVVYTMVVPLKIVSPGGTPVIYECNLRV